MAFPTITQQEINNRKILDELQHKKQLILQKGPIIGIPQQNPQEIALNTPANNLARAAWTLANNQSFGYFVTTDSISGNNILPVLPRFDQSPPNK